jgi:hypothetical protein
MRLYFDCDVGKGRLAGLNLGCRNRSGIIWSMLTEQDISSMNLPCSMPIFLNL